MPARKRPANLGDGIGYFHDWRDGEFACWLAGFFDGEGSVYLGNAKQGGITLSIGNTNRDIIASIARRTGVGTVEVREQTRERWNRTFIWRVRNYADARAVMLLMRPYLSIKSGDVDRALTRIAAHEAKRRVIADRNAAIRRYYKQAWPANKTHDDVARHFGVSRATVSLALSGKARVA